MLFTISNMPTCKLANSKIGRVGKFVQYFGFDLVYCLANNFCSGVEKVANFFSQFRSLVLTKLWDNKIGCSMDVVERKYRVKGGMLKLLKY